MNVTNPRVKDPLILRAAKVMDTTPRGLALLLDVPFEDIKNLMDDRFKLAELDRDNVWIALQDHVTQRIGMLLALRTELERTLAHQQQKRAAHVARAVNRKTRPRQT